MLKTNLIAKGWKMYYECLNPCKKQYFNHPDKPGYEVRVRTKMQTFSILLNNSVIAGPLWSYDLDKELIKHEL